MMTKQLSETATALVAGDQGLLASGSDAMQPMAIPSVGGVGVKLITFLVAPCLYCLVKEWQFRRASSSAPPASPMHSPQP